jgi:hypothetical protein
MYLFMIRLHDHFISLLPSSIQLQRLEVLEERFVQQVGGIPRHAHGGGSYFLSPIHPSLSTIGFLGLQE